MNAARVLVYCGVFALGGASEDWHHVGWRSHLVTVAIVLAFMLGRWMRAA